jgi:hypothetical protein
MGVSVRMSRNTRVYLPFWLAIPLYLLVATVWLVMLVLVAIPWIVLTVARAVSQSRSRATTTKAQRPEVIAAEQARQEEYRRWQKADHDSRTRRGVIAECRIDPLNGGSFTIRAEGMEMVFNLDPNAAIHFLSLKKGDIVQVTLAPDRTGLEEFWQLSRANGAKPRSPVELTAADMEWLGLAAKASPPPSS